MTVINSVALSERGPGRGWTRGVHNREEGVLKDDGSGEAKKQKSYGKRRYVNLDAFKQLCWVR